ncbi:MAG: ribonuclease Y [Nitrospirae bacterium]|nr:ribonuclease Y [Nitrospirota bacterium]
MFKINTIATIILLAAAIGIGFAAGFILKKMLSERELKGAAEQAKRIIQEAEKEAEVKRKEAAIEAKDKLYQARMEFDKETREKRNEINSLERRLLQREDNLEKKVELIEKKENEVNRKERDVASREKLVVQKEDEYNKALRDIKQQLEMIAGMSAEEAKKQLMFQMENEAKFESAKLIKRIEDEAKDTAEKKAKNIISLAVQKYASDYVAEATVSLVNLPSDEMKGRIIGREGRNIRAIENATGVDLIIDDTPEAVILSSFDPVRREVARITLERLIADGRIHPARIEELAEKVRKELENTMKEEAEKAVFDVGIHEVHPEIMKLLGRLRFRTSYGQNNLQHAREVAFVCGVMASELGLDVKLAKRAALLHDIGKAADHQEEGTHAAIGAELARKYGESPKIVNAIAAHHEETQATSPEAVLVAASDALSAARPGVRKETLQSYVKRLEKLEGIATSFKGVEKAYAVQAGREIRIIVKQEAVSDVESAQISRDVAKRVEQELTYPGQIKVTVIRESRYVEFAK